MNEDILVKLRRNYDAWWEEQCQVHCGPPPPDKEVERIYRLLDTPYDKDPSDVQQG